MATGNPDTFIDSTVINVCRIAQLTETPTASSIQVTPISEPITDDPVVRLCAGIALAQVEAFCNRTFVKSSFVEHYWDVDSRFRLRNWPVVIDDISQVKLVPVQYAGYVSPSPETEVILTTDNYELIGDATLILKDADELLDSLYDTASYNFLTGFDAELDRHTSSNFLNVVVSYQGGFLAADENRSLLQALITQTLVNYHRRDHLGVTALIGVDDQSIRGHYQDVDAGELHTTAKRLVESLVYYGRAESLTHV